jgi:two-component system, NtrC family, response regulator HydG
MAAIAAPGFLRSRSRILVASADPAFRQRVMNNPALGAADREEAVGGAHALARLLQISCDSVLLDRNLPDLDAREVAEQIRKQYPQIAVELVDSRTESDSVDDVEIRDKEADLRGIGERNPAVEEEESELVHEALIAAEPLPGMIGASRAMEQVYRLVRMVAGRGTAVLITGRRAVGRNWWRGRSMSWASARAARWWW